METPTSGNHLSRAGALILPQAEIQVPRIDTPSKCEHRAENPLAEI